MEKVCRVRGSRGTLSLKSQTKEKENQVKQMEREQLGKAGRKPGTNELVKVKRQ